VFEEVIPPDSAARTLGNDPGVATLTGTVKYGTTNVSIKSTVLLQERCDRMELRGAARAPGSAERGPRSRGSTA